MTDSQLLTGSICSGTGALDMAVTEVLGAKPAWFCQYEPPNKDGVEDKYQFAARILAHHWPKTPNHGDITKVDWSSVEKVELITAGWPCENMSVAGLQEGLVAGVQSGLWFNVVDAIRAQIAMRTADEAGPVVFLENVRGLLSARADRGVGPTDPDVEAAGRDALRALGCVLGDLADLGLDAEWLGLPASGVGACHDRWREFILAWPAAADTAHLGHERGRDARERRHGLEDRSQAAAHAHHVERDREPRQQPRGLTAARSGARGVDWGPYRAAIERHEHVFGRPAPRPTQPGQSGGEQLSAHFVEWMMALPEGHVCDVPAAPGMSAAGLRNARLTALGKGVVPAQAAYALRELLARTRDVPAIRLLLARAGSEVAA